MTYFDIFACISSETRSIWTMLGRWSGGSGKSDAVEFSTFLTLNLATGLRKQIISKAYATVTQVHLPSKWCTILAAMVQYSRWQHRYQCGKGQNPLHQFPRRKSVTSWHLSRLRGSYGETCLMDFGHNYTALPG